MQVQPTLNSWAMPPILVGNYLVYNFETNYFAENFLTKLSRCTEDNEKIT